MSMLSGRKAGNPWWDAGGRTARRRRRRLIALAALAAATIVASAALAPRPVLGASLNVDLDQWASLDAAWQNGNLNGNNARYPEGGVIPFRLAIEGLTPGDHQITIQYDFTAGGHKAYDFLAGWSVWTRPNLCAPSGGAISSRCPALGTPDTEPFPADPYVANGLAVSLAQAYSGAPRYLTIYGGTITSIGRAVHAGSVDGNSTAQHRVRFRSSGSAVLLVWGGHLAQSAFWDRAVGGPSDGAGEVSGAPWHMRTLSLDGSGARNQDRSIQPSAIVGSLPPNALAPSPTPTPVAPAPPVAPSPTPAPVAPAPTPTPRTGTTPPRVPWEPDPAPPVAPAAPPTGTVPPNLTPPPTTTSAPIGPGPSTSLPAGLWLVTVLAVASATVSTRLARRRR